MLSVLGANPNTTYAELTGKFREDSKLIHPHRGGSFNPLRATQAMCVLNRAFVQVRRDAEFAAFCAASESQAFDLASAVNAPIDPEFEVSEILAFSLNETDDETEWLGIQKDAEEREREVEEERSARDTAGVTATEAAMEAAAAEAQANAELEAEAESNAKAGAEAEAALPHGEAPRPPTPQWRTCGADYPSLHEEDSPLEDEDEEFDSEGDGGCLAGPLVIESRCLTRTSRRSNARTRCNGLSAAV